MRLILRFDQMPGNFSLDPERPKKRFYIPISNNPKRPNFIRVQNGRGTFCWSIIRRKQFRSKGHGHFWKIPKGAIAFLFPHLLRSTRGWFYGEPEWIF